MSGRRNNRSTAFPAAVAGAGAVGRSLTGLPVQGGKISLAFRGIPGRVYLIPRSTGASRWTTLATAAAGPGVPPPGQAVERTVC